MKKTIWVSLLLGSCAGVFAQDSLMNTTNANAPTSNVNASSSNAMGNTPTSAPASVQSSFSKDYPNAGTPTWEQSGDEWKASYNNAGRNTHVYYNARGASYSVALPVLNTYVPEEMVSKALSMHGNKLYSITMVKGAEGQNVFGVTLVENGQSKVEWVGEDGATAMNVFRTEMTTDVNGNQTSAGTGTNMNSGSTLNNGATGSSMNANGTTTISTGTDTNSTLNNNTNAGSTLGTGTTNGTNNTAVDTTTTQLNNATGNGTNTNNTGSGNNTGTMGSQGDSAVINRTDSTLGTGNNGTGTNNSTGNGTNAPRTTTNSRGTTGTGTTGTTTTGTGTTTNGTKTTDSTTTPKKGGQ